MSAWKYAAAGAVKGLGDAMALNGKAKREEALLERKIAADEAMETKRQAGAMAVVERQGEIATDAREQGANIEDRLARLNSSLRVVEGKGTLEQQLKNAITLAKEQGNINAEAEARKMAHDAGMADLAATYARDARDQSADIATTARLDEHGLNVARDNNSAFNARDLAAQNNAAVDKRTSSTVTAADGTLHIVRNDGSTLKTGIVAGTKRTATDDRALIQMVEDAYRMPGMTGPIALTDRVKAAQDILSVDPALARQYFTTNMAKDLAVDQLSGRDKNDPAKVAAKTNEIMKGVFGATPRSLNLDAATPPPAASAAAAAAKPKSPDYSALDPKDRPPRTAIAAPAVNGKMNEAKMTAGSWYKAPNGTLFRYDGPGKKFIPLAK